MQGWIYILSLCNGKYYVGSTSNLERRIEMHNQGLSQYTSKFLPVALVFSKHYDTYKQARRAEIWIKKLKDRKFLERIISEQEIKKKF